MDMRTNGDKVEAPKRVEWVGSSRRELRQFPKGVRLVFGQAIFDAQMGVKHPAAKSLKGFGGAGVLEIAEDESGSSYRAVYTVKFEGVVYVLHAFQKKSKKGIKTPRIEIVKIRSRLREAENHYAQWKERTERQEPQ